jgi:WhiB family redox-sensing transcriptional regulator
VAETARNPFQQLPEPLERILGDLGREWTLQAACRNHPRPDIFHPPRARASQGNGMGQSASELRRRLIVAEAKSVCARCPVRAREFGGTGECLDYGEAIGDYNAIWGGKTGRERGRRRDEG